MLKRNVVVMIASVLLVVPVFAQKPRYMYLCRSPLLAENFWGAIQNLRRQGVTITPTIALEICKGMKVGEDPQCLRAEGEDFKPVASGWGGALAMSDGKTKVWFHQPDAGGWVHPDYHVQYINPAANK